MKKLDHSHITCKYRGSAHWNCNINFQLTKKIPVIFPNIKGYDSHSIFLSYISLIYENLELLKQKGAYPYEYMNSFKRFNEDKLCARKYFYSSTKDKKISEDGKISDGHVSIEDYMVCERIWDKFKMKNMGDYHDHYLKKDVLLLADVFEKFIDTCLKYYELDPCHYFGAPWLSLDAMLKMTGVK